MNEWPLRCHDHGITGTGPVNARLMIVGIAPGFNEVQEGIPFVGASGRLLDTLLRAVGIPREDVFLTNLLCWRPEDDKPTPEDIEACLPHLRREIERVRPSLIIPLGAIPAEVLTQSNPHARGKNGKFSIAKLRGQPLWYDNVLDTSWSCRIMATWHPAAFLRESGQNYIIDLARDFQKLMPPPKGQDILNWERGHSVWDWGYVQDIFPYGMPVLGIDYPVAIDIETGNAENVDEMTMDVFREQVLCFSIAQWLPDRGTHSWIYLPEDFPLFVEWFEREGHLYKWLTHYGFFDKQGLKRMLGVDIHIHEDTLAASYALDERQGVHSLKSLAREYTGASWWEAPIHEFMAEWKRKSALLALAMDPQAVPSFTNGELGDPAVELSKREKPKKGESFLVGGLAERLVDVDFHRSRRTMDSLDLARYNARLEAIAGQSWSVIPLSILAPYNAEDSARTAQLLEVLRPMMEDDNVLWLYENILIPDMNVNADISYVGMHVNQERLDNLTLKWGPRWQELQAELQQEATARGFVNTDPAGNPTDEPLNLNAPRQKAKFIFDVLAIEPPVSKHVLTKTGQQSTNIKLIERVKDEDSWLAKYVAFVHLDHSLGAYILPMPGHLRDDGRIHAQWKPHAARTGRDSFANPPLHQIPKYVEEDVEFLRFIGGTGHELRELFDTGDPDLLFWEADFQRGEFYAGAYLTGDEALLRMCRSQDMHAQVAADILYHIPLSDVTSKQRRDAKYVNFGMFFGIQEEALAKDQLHCPVWEAAQLIRDWWDGFPQARAKVQEWKLEAMRTGEIVTPGTGRKRRFRLILGSDSFHELNQAVNAPIQGLLGDYQKAARIELADKLPPSARILITCHDAIGGHVSTAEVDTTLVIVQEVMERPRFGFPGIPVDISVGPDWGHTKPWEGQTRA